MPQILLEFWFVLSMTTLLYLFSVKIKVFEMITLLNNLFIKYKSNKTHINLNWHVNIWMGQKSKRLKTAAVVHKMIRVGLQSRCYISVPVKPYYSHKCTLDVHLVSSFLLFSFTVACQLYFSVVFITIQISLDITLTYIAKTQTEIIDFEWFDQLNITPKTGR